jgi:hypothetical protein
MVALTISRELAEAEPQEVKEVADLVAALGP